MLSRESIASRAFDLRSRVSELLVHPSMGTEPGEPWGDHGPLRRKLEYEAMLAPEARAVIAYLRSLPSS